jgi:hypothetical protein
MCTHGRWLSKSPLLGVVFRTGIGFSLPAKFTTFRAGLVVVASAGVRVRIGLAGATAGRAAGGTGTGGEEANAASISSVIPIELSIRFA